MPWVFWQIKSKAGTDPPKKWNDLSQRLLKVLPWKYVTKIELIAFVIKGERKARWLLDMTDPEYCTKKEAMEVAKKLAWLILLSRDSPRIGHSLRSLLACKETDGCKLLAGHIGNCRTKREPFAEPTRCQLCGRRISYEDFNRNARRDPNGITVGHRTPLPRTTRGHNARNIAWAHRACNQLPSEQTIDEVLIRMKEILELNGYTVMRR